MENTEILNLLGKGGLGVVLLAALLYLLKTFVVEMVQNWRDMAKAQTEMNSQMVQAQIALNDSVTKMVVPKLDSISNKMHELALEDTARKNHIEAKTQLEQLSRELHELISFIKGGNTPNSVGKNTTTTN